MKYGESIFDIIYLMIAIVTGFMIIKNNNKLSKLIGSAVLILGFGDAFHLVPRVLNYFIDYDFNMYLGIGKLVTSITMSVFYVLLYYIYLNNYKKEKNKGILISIWLLFII